jgi:hypothetical protein
LRLATLFDNLACSPEEAYYADLCFLKAGGGQNAAGPQRLRGCAGQPGLRGRGCAVQALTLFGSLLQRIQYAI